MVTRILVILILLSALVVPTHSAPKIHTTQKAKEYHKVKQDIKDVLNPSEINAISDIEDVKAYLRKLQKLLRAQIPKKNQ